MHKHLPCTLSRLSSSEPSAIVPMSGCLPGLHPIHLYWFRTGMTVVPFATVSGDALSAYSRCSTMSAGGNLKTTKAIPHFVPDVYSAARRRDDLNSGLLAAIAHSRFWHKADIPVAPIHVRFRGQSGHQPRLPNNRDPQRRAHRARSRHTAAMNIVCSADNLLPRLTVFAQMP